MSHPGHSAPPPLAPRSASSRWAALWMQMGTRWLPFADAATEELPLARIVRLGLFQLSVGACLTLLTGTLNRVMIVELGVSATMVGAMLALPLFVAPFRALIGHRSDTYVSVLGWRRVPYIWFGTMMAWGGLAIMPFCLLLLSGDTRGTHGEAVALSAMAFLLVGAGMHTTQTAGLALATDLAPERARPRVVALLYLMLLAGTVVSAFAFSALLEDFSQLRLVKVIQGSALVVLALNVIALWKQEPRRPTPRAEVAMQAKGRPRFRAAWAAFVGGGRSVRLLVAVSLGIFGFNLQDVLLEPYGGEVLNLGVAGTTMLSGLYALGMLAAVGISARRLEGGTDPILLAAAGCLAGVAGFIAIIFAPPLGVISLFQGGVVLVGLGEGCFAVGTLTAVMAARDEQGVSSGLALGAWGAVYATSEGLALALSGVARDALGVALANVPESWGVVRASMPYSVIWHVEIAMLFATLVALGPLVARRRAGHTPPGVPATRFGLADLPG